jgi:hypothetical protein
MTCMRCKHAVPGDWPNNLQMYCYYGEEFSDSDRWNATVQCTLNPVWIEVKGGHFCSSDSSVMDPAAHNAWAYGTNRAWDEAVEQRKRAVEAEKKLKALRKKMREGK